jgi:hypothetical protein
MSNAPAPATPGVLLVDMGRFQLQLDVGSSKGVLCGEEAGNEQHSDATRIVQVRVSPDGWVVRPESQSGQKGAELLLLRSWQGAVTCVCGACYGCC